MERHRLGAIRLRGHDWFAWATCGGSNAVLLATDRGIADLLVTPTEITVLTDAIDGGRLRDEELPDGIALDEFGWTAPEEREAYVRDAAGGGDVACDMPVNGELPLPAELVAAKRRLHPAEIARYRALGRDAAEALTETISQVVPTATELDVAGLGSAAMMRRGIEPALVLVAGADRAARYRHPKPTRTQVGDRVSVVFCGRRSGLFANLTRHAYFQQPTPQERTRAEAVAHVEAAALGASIPGAPLATVYSEIVAAYARFGFAGAERYHHQGGTTGYLSREELATPASRVTIEVPVALAWNPSLPGSKIEDTVLRTTDALEVLTVDPTWPMTEIDGRLRPDLLVVD